MRFLVGVVGIGLVTVAGITATAWLAVDRASPDLQAADLYSLPTSTPVPWGTQTPPGGTLRSLSGATAGPTASASATGAITPQDRSVSVDGGQASLRCIGPSIELRIAQPSNGWRVSVERSGPEVVQVRFRRGFEADGVDEVETRLKALCWAGTPVFWVLNEK